MRLPSVAYHAGVWLVLLMGTNPSIGAQPAVKLLSLNVTKDKIAFNPKSCEVGATGAVHTGCEGARVTIIGRKDGKCLFQYATDGCGGVHAYYHGEVPVDAGLVTIEVFNGGIKKSFPENALQLIRSTGPVVTVLVEGTGEYVRYYHSERRSEMTPRPGDTVKFRFRVYDTPKFQQLMPNAMFDPSVEFVVGSGKAWPWLEIAMENMTVGDRRQIQVPVKIAEEAKKWLPGPSADKVLYLEMSLIAVERAK